jgi:hypothetical protein
MNIDQLKEKIDKLGKHSNFKDYALVIGESNSPGVERTLRLSLFTKFHKYDIRAHDQIEGTGYLGCTMSNRIPYTGENYTRGRDLHDGPFDDDTWVKILGDIVSCELEPLFKKENNKNLIENKEKTL